MSSSTGKDITDEALVQAVLRKEQHAFPLFVDRYEKLVLSIVFRMIKNTHDREDICQEVFLKVYDKLGSFRFGSKLSTWIGSIAFNTSINHLRKKRIVSLESGNEETGENMLPDNPVSQPDAILMKKEIAVVIWKMVEELSPVQQTALSLFHKQELSLEEIAAIMGSSIVTVKSHLFRARQILRKKLSGSKNKQI